MTTIEKIFALQRRFPFSELSLAERAHLASVMTTRQYRPDLVVHTETVPIKRVFVVAEGELIGHDGDRLPHIIGIRSLLFQEPLPAPVRAGPDGALCLCLPKPHFFTLTYECPEILLGLLRMRHNGGRPASSVSP